MNDPIQDAYLAGKELALNSYLEKNAFLGGVLQAGKFLAGFGHLGAKGSRLAGISAHHIGQPLGFGIVGAATADEGERAQGFAKGVMGGIAFNLGMRYGAPLGQRLLAPGFRGKNTFGIMKGMGFSDDAARQMAASQALNKPVHLGTSLGRKLTAGRASRAQLSDLGKHFSKNTANLNLTDDLLKQQQQLKKMFNQGYLSGPQQAELQKLYSEFTSNLYKGGYSTGTLGQRSRLKGVRLLKGVGTVGGGMLAGSLLEGPIGSAMDAQPASVFDARGEH